MVTRDLLKKEIDKVQDDHLEILYRVIKAFEKPLDSEDFQNPKTLDDSNWKKFIEATYGCMADDQIKRGEQGEYELREGIK